MRSIDFLTSSNLGRLQEESSAQREVAPQDSPVNSPVRMAQQPLTLIDEVVPLTPSFNCLSPW